MNNMLSLVSVLYKEYLGAQDDRCRHLTRSGVSVLVLDVVPQLLSVSFCHSSDCMEVSAPATDCGVSSSPPVMEMPGPL